MQHIDCFKQHGPDTRLPEAINGTDILAEMKNGMKDVQAAVDRAYPSDNLSTTGRNQRNRDVLLDIDNALKGLFTTSTQITTFGQLRRANEKSRDIIRENIHGGVEKRKVELDIQDKIIEIFVEACKKIHEKVEASLRVNTELMENQAASNRRQRLSLQLAEIISRDAKNLRVTGNGTMALEHEAIDHRALEQFAEFLLCADEALETASKAGTTFRRSMMDAPIKALTVNPEQLALFSAWATQVIPANFSIPQHGAATQVNGKDHFDAKILLLPKKLAVLRARKHPMDAPEWKMTPPELTALTQIMQEQYAGQEPKDLQGNGEFLSVAAQLINTLCSGGLAVLRGTIEIKNELLERAKPPPVVSPPPPKPPVANPVAPSLKTVPWQDWDDTMIQRYLDEVDREKRKDPTGAIARASAACNAPGAAMMYNNWKKKYQKL